MAGYCYLRLKDWGRARRHLQAALRLQDPSYVREGARRRLLLAHTYLRQDRPEVDHAVFLASRAVETLTGEVDSARVVGYLTQLVGHFASHRDVPPSGSSPSRPPDFSPSGDVLRWRVRATVSGGWGRRWGAAGFGGRRGRARRARSGTA